MGMTTVLVLLGGLSAAPVRSQESKEETKTSPRETRRAESDAREKQPTTDSQPTEEKNVEETPTVEGTARERIRERLRRAIRLPEVVQDSRDAGVPEDKVRDVLDSARERGVPAGDVEEILEVENEAIRQGGNPDHFGAAVQEMKSSGLRGRELAEAIHAEQYARGMKKPKKDKGYKGKGARKRATDKIDEQVQGAQKKVKEKTKGKPDKDERGKR